MIGSLAALTVAVLTATTQTDTTFAVKTGSRLELSNFSGDIAVETWAKNSVRVQAEHTSRAQVRIDSDGPRISIEIQHWRGLPTSVDYHLTVPKWMALNLSGINTEIHVLGSQAEVEAQTVQGEVSVTGGAHKVVASSVEGGVRVTGAQGRVECSSVNAGVEVQNVTGGPVSATSVNGEIMLEGIQAEDVEASTVNGEVSYIGSIQNGGSYRFSTHNGSVAVAVPERANATVTVSTFSGDFSSSFPIQIREVGRGKVFEFKLGDGSARLELESFQGEIRLRRPGEAEGRADADFYYQKDKQKSQSKQKSHSKQNEKNVVDEDQP